MVIYSNRIGMSTTYNPQGSPSSLTFSKRWGRTIRELVWGRGNTCLESDWEKLLKATVTLPQSE